VLVVVLVVVVESLGPFRPSRSRTRTTTTTTTIAEPEIMPYTLDVPVLLGYDA